MKVFQIALTDIPDEIQQCMDSVKGIYPDVEVLKRKSNKTGLDLIKEADNWQVEILSSSDDILYIDWDIMLDEPLHIDSNDLLSCNYYKDGYPDYSIVYSPKKEIWEHIEKERIKRGISKDKFGWLRSILRHMRVNEIQGNYKHLRYTSTRR